MNDKGMKRFWLFGGVQHYACGGFRDFVDHFDTLREALDEAKRRTERTPNSFEWWDIFDTETLGFCGSVDEPYGDGKLPRLPPLDFLDVSAEGLLG